MTTRLTFDQILTILDWYIENAQTMEDFGAVVALRGFRAAITQTNDFDALWAHLTGPKP